MFPQEVITHKPISVLLCALALSACSEATDEGRVLASTVVRVAPLVDSVTATGRVHTVTSVKVSSQLSGRIDEVYVDFNDIVQKDQPLARLDPHRFQSRVDELNATLSVAEADLQSTLAAIEGLQALSSEDASDYHRKMELSGKGSVSASELSRAEAKMRQSASTLKVRRFLKNKKLAAVAAAKASLGQAMIDLDRSVIKAPIAGVVINRSIDSGQTVAASLSAPDLFTIAHDLHDIEIHARVDEADIGKIAVKQRVKFTVDAYPGKIFGGIVRQIRKAPEISQNVVSYTVIVDAPNPEELMLPGMTALLEIVTAYKGNVLQVPNAALRFEMPVSKLGIDPGEYEKSDGARVWVVSNMNSYEPRDLTIGYSDREFSEVLSGVLTPGEQVVVGYEY